MMIFGRQIGPTSVLLGVSERENRESRGEKNDRRNNTRKSPRAEDLALQRAGAWRNQ